MRINEVTIENFKNLQNFSISFDENKIKTVLLGQNASGKSNFIEALLLIFKFLDLSNSTTRNYPPFNYSIDYQIRDYNVKIIYKNKKYAINIDEKEKDETLKYFFSDESKKLYQPKYVFTYYSGLSNRLKEHFWRHQDDFYRNIIKADFKDENIDSLRRLFHVQLVHSYFVMMAYFSFEEDETKSISFLNDIFNIKDIESILFILKRPFWLNDSRLRKNSNDRFWTSEGLVRTFLDSLWDYSLAPIYHEENIQVNFYKKEPQDRLYLYLSSKDKLRKLAKDYKTNTGFFKALESTYLSGILEEVKIKVKKENVDESITFKELSEGEQQLLTVLGLLKFTKDEESLILLDEPDTHLNPLWKWKYFEFLDNVVGKNESTQIIVSTHDPLVIGNLTKEEVRIFKKDEGKVRTVQPKVDPQGLGVAGILISELFGLPTILDKTTQETLNKKRYLQGKLIRNKLKPEEIKEYERLKEELERKGFYEEVEDIWFRKYLAEMSKHEIFQKIEFTEDEQNFLEEESERVMLKILKEMKDNS